MQKSYSSYLSFHILQVLSKKNSKKISKHLENEIDFEF
jgi:hypothetical protein